jgi:archaellum biogenesis ATPase FlaH
MARNYLATAPIAVEGSGSETVVKRVVPMLWEYGLGTTEDILELLYERRPDVNEGRSWSDRCQPPWDDPNQLAHYIDNGLTYCVHSPQGCRLPQADFIEPYVDDGTTETPGDDSPKPPRLYVELFSDVVLDLTRASLVERLLDPGAMAVVYGQSNSGKTFLSLDLAFHIATGRPWMGRAVKGGSVLYIAAEGSRGVRKRILALRKHYAIDDAPLGLVPCAVDLSGQGADVEPLLTLIAEYEPRIGRPVLIVVDTLSRVLAGSNENSSEDMTAYIGNVDKIRNRTKAHVLTVHHSGKNHALGARGHSSLRAATDTELEVADWQIQIKKQRDMEAGAPIGFKLHPVELGRDASGRMVTSCVVLPDAVGAVRDFGPGAIKGPALKALTVLEALNRQSGEVGKATWQRALRQEHYAASSRQAAQQAFERSLRELRQAGCVQEGPKGGFLATRHGEAPIASTRQHPIGVC